MAGVDRGTHHHQKNLLESQKFSIVGGGKNGLERLNSQSFITCELGLIGPYLVVRCEDDTSWINIEMWEIYYEEPLLHFSPNTRNS